MNLDWKLKLKLNFYLTVTVTVVYLLDYHFGNEDYAKFYSILILSC